jgi:hypothetical protein
MTGLDLSDTADGGTTLQTLYDALSRYVALDLTGCTTHPFLSINIFGNKKISAALLPETPANSIPNFTNVESLALYLNGQAENTPATPYLIKINDVDLSKNTAAGNTLRTLYEALSRYVALDLTGCTGASIANVTLATAPNKVHMVSITLPDTVSTIKQNTFWGCTALKSVTGGGVQTIENGAFSNDTAEPSCTALESVYFPALTSIPYDSTHNFRGAFYKCTALSSVYIPLVQTLGNYAFTGCTSLESLNIPAVTTIGTSALSGCTALKSIDTPALTALENGAFSGCSSLEAIAIPSAVTALKDNTFNGCSSLATVALPGVTTIGSSVFYECAALDSLDLSNITTLGGSAFKGCSSLSAASLPGITSLEGSTFANCTSLATIDIVGVTTIGSSALSGCTALTSLYLPAVTAIKGSAFKDCSALVRVTMGSEPPELGSSVFTNTLFTKATSVAVMYVPGTAVQTYQETTKANWSVNIKNKVTALPD